MLKRLFLAAILSVSVIANGFAEGRLVKTDNKKPVVAEPGLMADTSRVFDIDEVVVVSQPKEAFRLRLQSLASTSFSQSDLRSMQARDLRDLSVYVPSFVMPAYGSRLTSSIYVRGIGSRINSPVMGIYVDGMPIQNKSAFNFHLYEIDRVDVLRGPQGTLYGMNTEGGLIRLYSKNPFDYQGTDVNLSLGTHFWRKAEVAHYGKVSDKFAFSLAGFYDGQNGFLKNAYDNSRADDFNEAGGKARLMFRPTSRLSLDVIADYQYVNQHAFPYGLLDRESGETADYNTNLRNSYRRNLLNTGLNINYRGNGYELTSSTSYQYLRDYMLMDIDYSPRDVNWLEQHQLKNGLTQELALKGQTGLWHWTLGMFGSYEWLKTTAPVHFGTAVTDPISNGIYTAMYNAMLRRMTPEQIERMGGVKVSAFMDVPGLFRTPSSNFAVFHESNLNLTDRLKVTLGLRYDYSHAQIDFETMAITAVTVKAFGQEATNALTSALSRHHTSDYNQLLPKLGVSYQFGNRGSNIYATVSKGYRAGGYNIQMFSDVLRTEMDDPQYRNIVSSRSYDIPHDDEAYSDIINTISYKPETSWNYEVGAHLNLLGDALHADVAAYYMQIRNQQLTMMAGNYGYGRAMVNAGKSYSCGAEVALRGRLLDNALSYALSYGYTHAAFKDYKDEETAEDGSVFVVDYKDKRVPFVPAHTFSASADYRFRTALVSLPSIVVGANVTGQGKSYWDVQNLYAQKFYALLGAHVDLNWQLSKLSGMLSFWGRNLTNTIYNTFAFPIKEESASPHYAQKGNSIQLGVDVKLHF